MLNMSPAAVSIHQKQAFGSDLTVRKQGKKVLIVDDEYLIRFSLKRYVEDEGFTALTADSGADAIKCFEEYRPEVVLLDIGLPDTSGLSLLKAIKEAAPETTAIMITACADVRSSVEAMKLGALDYLEKPISFEKLTEVLNTIKTRNHAEPKAFSNDGFVFASDAMKEITRITELLAVKSDLTALILGESGTGKSLLCKVMHDMSPRRDKPFVDIGCSSIPEHLFESELFGHEKGAFTDAKILKKGLIEMAAGGTVFLDEIGDMPYNMQSKILSLIEEKRFRRVGGLQYIHADVRIFAATNRNLHDLVQAKKFRLDLYYRLNVATVEMPPLRERREDIPVLVEHYFKCCCGKYGVPVKIMTARAVQTLQEYLWPGNIRELKNLIEKLVILSKSDLIDVDDLSSGLLMQSRRPVTGTIERSPETADTSQNRGPGRLSLKSMEEEHIRTALKLAEGNQRKAARLLDITRDTLRYRMKRLGIDSSVYAEGRMGASLEQDSV